MKISVVIPCFNHGHFIREAIESVERAPEAGIFEIIIVNDGSTDQNTIEVLRALSAEGYTVLDQKNAGVGAARNAGIRAASGKYILPLDSDNKIRSDVVIEAMRKMDEDDSIDVAYGDANHFGTQNRIWKAGDFNLRRMMIRNSIDACALIRKATLERFGGYDEKKPVLGFDDWDLWLRIGFAEGTFFYLEKIMIDYRVREDSMLRSRSGDDERRLNRYLQEKHKEHYLPRGSVSKLLLSLTSPQKRALFLHYVVLNLSPQFYNYLLKRGWL